MIKKLLSGLGILLVVIFYNSCVTVTNQPKSSEPAVVQQQKEFKTVELWYEYAGQPQVLEIKIPNDLLDFTECYVTTLALKSGLMYITMYTCDDGVYTLIVGTPDNIAPNIEILVLSAECVDKKDRYWVYNDSKEPIKTTLEEVVKLINKYIEKSKNTGSDKKSI